MGSEQLRKEVEERIGFGYTRQHVFDELVLAHPEVKPKKIADLVRYVPSLAARMHYRTQQQALLVCIGASTGLEVVRAFDDETLADMSAFRLIRLLPLATLFLGVAVYRWRGEVYQWLGMVNLIGGLHFLSDLAELFGGSVDTGRTIADGLSLAICVLAWYLGHYLFPKYSMDKDPLGRMKDRAVFPPEPGVSMF